MKPEENEPKIFDPNGNDAYDAAVDQALNATEQERLKSELQAADERVLRVQAELENYRKRVRREMDDERKYASLPLVRDLLAVIDNLQRAVSAAQQSADSSGLLEGVKMVAVQFETVLQQHQCVRIATVGTEFDPNLHQAIAQESSADIPAGKITREAQVGYLLHDRVVRPAQVFVSTGAPA